MPMTLNRRQFIAGTTLALAQGVLNPAFTATSGGPGRLKQAVARWCFGSVPIEDFCAALRDMGITGMDLVGPEEWEMCRKYGITPSIVQGAGSFRPAPAGSPRPFGPAFGWNRIENHQELMATARRNIDLAVAADLPNIIGLFGDRQGMSDAEGIDNCVKGLKQIVPYLEEKRITLGIELLNSKVDHPDYQGDNTPFGVEVCKQVGSERVKLVYDAYHMQIMEGNLIETIRANIDYFCHIHVAGVPGRHEIDATQEVNWRAVATAIADIGFKGYVSHEWTPTGPDPLGALRAAVELLTV
ncbi:MAG: hydroxypyruvate isomerase [Gammaproteobacteria bacterium]|nr:MAG: hydroxypyruvate isomerase [Gammaproteobacteria bacterium]